MFHDGRHSYLKSGLLVPNFGKESTTDAETVEAFRTTNDLVKFERPKFPLNWRGETFPGLGHLRRSISVGSDPERSKKRQDARSGRNSRPARWRNQQDAEQEEVPHDCIEHTVEDPRQVARRRQAVQRQHTWCRNEAVPACGR